MAFPSAASADRHGEEVAEGTGHRGEREREFLGILGERVAAPSGGGSGLRKDVATRVDRPVGEVAGLARHVAHGVACLPDEGLGGASDLVPLALALVSSFPATVPAAPWTLPPNSLAARRCVRFSSISFSCRRRVGGRRRAEPAGPPVRRAPA